MKLSIPQLMFMMDYSERMHWYHIQVQTCPAGGQLGKTILGPLGIVYNGFKSMM